LAELHGLADELVAGRADHGATTRQIVEEGSIGARPEDHVAEAPLPPRSVQAHFRSGAGQGLENRIGELNRALIEIREQVRAVARSNRSRLPAQKGTDEAYARRARGG